jgi:uncharacterized protein
MRIVADTNTVVSGLLWQGAPRRLIEAALSGHLTLVASQALLSELAEVLAREKFATRIRKAKISARAPVEDYAAIAHLVEPIKLTRTVTRDPDDDQIIACAITEETRKGTARAGQEYEDPLLVLRGDEYQTLSFAHLHQQLCDALRRDRPRLDLIFLSPEGDLRLFLADGSTQEVPRDDEP